MSLTSNSMILLGILSKEPLLRGQLLLYTIGFIAVLRKFQYAPVFVSFLLFTSVNLSEKYVALACLRADITSFQGCLNSCLSLGHFR